MRQLRYSVAASLDGCIAGPNGEFDWIVIDPDIDFEKMYRGFSGIVMGRKSYEVFAATGGSPIALPTWVYSRTLPEGERDGVTFARDAVPHVRRLKKSGGKKPLWLWGGGELFRELAEAGLVDGIDVAVIPVVLGDGIPLMPPPGPRLSLRLRRQRLYRKTGTLFLEYDVRKSGRRRSGTGR
ncbi:MAG TPA: dihydrofolate reductase family protein [Vicinamibacterales bacterium]|nr:dihydrofolate reductase family protein [Vicinamibacterales bacterium]